MFRSIVSVAFLVLTGCGFPGIPVTTDLSVFQQFEYSRQFPVFDFYYAAPGAVLEATIQNSQGSFTLEMTVLENFRAFEAGQTECLEPTVLTLTSDWQEGCADRVVIVPRELTPDEVQHVQSVFEKVSYQTGALFPCGIGVIVDPYFVDQYRWDNIELSNFECGSTHLVASEQEEIQQLLGSLK
jgi:hypothetical protein